MTPLCGSSWPSVFHLVALGTLATRQTDTLRASVQRMTTPPRAHPDLTTSGGQAPHPYARSS